MSLAEVTENMNLNELRKRDWYVQACCAKTGEGLYQGLDWLCNFIQNKGKKK